MKRTVEFKNKDIAWLCQNELENEAGVKVERDIIEHNGIYRVVCYPENCLEEGKANRIIRKYTIG